VPNSKNCAHDTSSVKPRSTHSRRTARWATTIAVIRSRQ
jgi:hypothetical protein